MLHLSSPKIQVLTSHQEYLACKLHIHESAKSYHKLPKELLELRFRCDKPPEHQLLAETRSAVLATCKQFSSVRLPKVFPLLTLSV